MDRKTILFAKMQARYERCSALAEYINDAPFLAEVYPDGVVALWHEGTNYLMVTGGGLWTDYPQASHDDAYRLLAPLRTLPVGIYRGDYTHAVIGQDEGVGFTEVWVAPVTIKRTWRSDLAGDNCVPAYSLGEYCVIVDAAA